MRILVVEDDISIQNIISQYLEHDGHEVRRAAMTAAATA